MQEKSIEEMRPYTFTYKDVLYIFARMNYTFQLCVIFLYLVVSYVFNCDMYYAFILVAFILVVFSIRVLFNVKRIMDEQKDMVKPYFFAVDENCFYRRSEFHYLRSTWNSIISYKEMRNAFYLYPGPPSILPKAIWNEEELERIRSYLKAHKVTRR